MTEQHRRGPSAESVLSVGRAVDARLGDDREAPGFDDIVERARTLAGGPATEQTNIADQGSIPERVAAVRELIELSGDDRGLLERAQRPYLDRIQRDSADFEATSALSLLVAATAHSRWRMDRLGRRDFAWERGSD